MASFPDVRPPSEPSADAEGLRVLRRLLAASGTAAALSELATLRGKHAVHPHEEVPV